MFGTDVREGERAGDEPDIGRSWNATARSCSHDSHRIGGGRAAASPRSSATATTAVAGAARRRPGRCRRRDDPAGRPVRLRQDDADLDHRRPARSDGRRGRGAGRRPDEAVATAARSSFRGKNIGFVFQQYNLLPALTAAENAAVPLLIAGMAAAPGGRARPRETARASSGMGEQARRAAVAALRRPAAARRHRPRPGPRAAAAGLRRADGGPGRPVAARRVMELLRRVAVQPDRAVIVVTHDSRVFRFGDRIVYDERRAGRPGRGRGSVVI